MEKFEAHTQNEAPGNPEKLEGIKVKIENLRTLFLQAETAYIESGTNRELGKQYLKEIYTTLIDLNAFDPKVVVNPISEWNPNGQLSEEEFNELNRRRKIFSNEIGIMTQSGAVRHDLNPDVPERLQIPQ